MQANRLRAWTVGALGSPRALFASGAALLALHPLLWLMSTWSDEAYNSQGLWIATTVAALMVWSMTSERLPGTALNERYAMSLLAFSAVVRLISQLLRVNVLGALTLALDVYAIGTLAALPQRRRALSPGWLAVLFTLSLPLERVLQRLIGYGLQQISADGACTVLGWLDRSAHCVGTRILIAGQDVLVDLPCSGARGLLALFGLFVVVAAILRPTSRLAVAGVLVTLIAAVIGNILRLVLLALGLAYPQRIGGIALMEAPWHELLGLTTLLVSALPVLVWARFVARRMPTQSLASMPPPPTRMHGDWLRHRGAACGFVALAAVIVGLPAHPVDVSRAIETTPMPAAIGEWRAEALPLSALEENYFVRYGGAARRAAYGPNSLLLVSTAAPLRHLHDPDVCLRGSGHSVRYVGIEHGVLPSAIYRSVDPEGRSWRVAVSYVSSRGERAANVSEVVWRWLRAPGATWTMVERITPWRDDDRDPAQRWDAAVARALDLAPSTEIPSLHLVPNAV